MDKIGYVLFSKKKANLKEEGEYLTNAGCAMVFGDPFDSVHSHFPNFDLMINSVNENDIIVIRDLSNLAVNSKHLKRVVVKLEKRSLHLFSIDQPAINTCKQGKKKVYQLIKLFHDLYGIVTGTSSKIAIQELNMLGRTNGRKKGLFPDQLKLAKQAYFLKEEKKMGVSEIIALLKTSKATYYRYIKYGELGLLKNNSLLITKKTKIKSARGRKKRRLSEAQLIQIKKASILRFGENKSPKEIMDDLNMTRSFFYNHVHTKKEAYSN